MEQKTLAKTKAWLFAKARQRIPERDFGITGDIEPPAYDEMLRFVRDGGWMPIKEVLKEISRGSVLEVGPGPGYLGLEWLKHRIHIDSLADSAEAFNRKEEELRDRYSRPKGNCDMRPL
jgi:hypothetical protein